MARATTAKMPRGVRKLPSGMFQARLMHEGTTYDSPTFVHIQQAVSWYNGTKTALKIGTYRDPKLPSKDSVFYDFAVEDIALRDLAASTTETYTKLLNNHLGRFHSLKITAISTAMVDKWFSELTKTGKRTIAAKSYTLLSAIMHRAIRQEIITKNPCSINGARTTSSDKPVYVPTDDEVRALAENIHPRFQLMVLLDATIGLRFGELISLRRNDFTLIGSGPDAYWNVRVNKSTTLVNKVFVEGGTKSARGVRTLPVHPALTAHISEHLKTRVSSTPDALVFTSANGQHVRNDVFRNNIVRAFQRAGIDSPNFTIHSLRHYAATNFANTGGNMRELQDFLGDSTTAAAMRYLHARPNLNTLTARMPISNLLTITPALKALSGSKQALNQS